jgi:hypothetical protein
VLRGVASGVGLSFAVRPMGRSPLRGVASGVGLLWVVVVAGLTGGGGFTDLRKERKKISLLGYKKISLLVVLSLYVLQSQTEAQARFMLQQKTKREHRSTERRERKKSDEMRLREKNRQYILGGPDPANSFFNRIQNVYKVYSSFSFVKSYCTLCKKIWR